MRVGGTRNGGWTDGRTHVGGVSGVPTRSDTEKDPTRDGDENRLGTPDKPNCPVIERMMGRMGSCTDIGVRGGLNEGNRID